MKRIFIDTNVILDLVLCRDGAENALDIFQLGEENKVELTVSFLSMANIAYVARKHRTKEELYDYLRELSSLFKILEMNEDQYIEALNTVVTDFEDYLQYICALKHGCETIVTNNTKDYKFSEIPVVTPTEFLRNPQQTEAYETPRFNQTD